MNLGVLHFFRLSMIAALGMLSTQTTQANGRDLASDLIRRIEEIHYDHPSRSPCARTLAAVAESTPVTIQQSWFFWGRERKVREQKTAQVDIWLRNLPDPYYAGLWQTSRILSQAVNRGQKTIDRMGWLTGEVQRKYLRDIKAWKTQNWLHFMEAHRDAQGYQGFVLFLEKGLPKNEEFQTMHAEISALLRAAPKILDLNSVYLTKYHSFPDLRGSLEGLHYALKEAWKVIEKMRLDYLKTIEKKFEDRELFRVRR